MSSREVLERVCADECDGRYCILKEITLHSQCDRTLIQLKAIEIHKYLISRERQREHTWQEATLDWVENKWAELFAKHYAPELSPIEIYKRIEGELK
jgi:hypothetical protein